MSAYIIAAIDRLDLVKYKEYSVRAREALAMFGATISVVDDSPVLIEGKMPGARAVVLKFPDEATLDRFWQSEKYQEAIPFRHAGATTHFVIKVKGED
jgi:uncharacterized protein (DUF1330 family)